MMDKACISEALGLTGRIILENGGEAYRVEDTVERLGLALGLNRTEVYSVPGGVIMTLVFADGEMKTQVVRCKKRTIDLDKVDRANRISRDVAAGLITPAKALIGLEEVAHLSAPHPLRVTMLAAAISAAGFTVMFMGTAMDALLAAVAAIAVQSLLRLLRRRDMRERVVSSLLGGALATLLPRLFALALDVPLSQAAVAGAMMQLLPGLAMTNAVQDLLRGDITSGLGNAMNALLTATMVAGGALAAGRLLLLLI